MLPVYTECILGDVKFVIDGLTVAAQFVFVTVKQCK